MATKKESNTRGCCAKHLDSSMPDSRLARTCSKLARIAWLAADSVNPASARRMGTPDFSSVCSWRAKISMSTVVMPPRAQA